MKRNEKFVISINREIGSGGRTVGEKLAKRLNVSFYDKALIKALTAEFHLTVEEVEKLKGQKASWWTEFQRKVLPFSSTGKAKYYQTSDADDPELLTSDVIFKTECKILEGIVNVESCVIAGRSGFYVFRNNPNHLSILIQAPMESRIHRVMVKQDIGRDEAIEIINKVDRMRENYVNYFTHSTRYDTRNYDLVINMDNLTEDDAVDLIMDYICKTDK